MIDDEKSKVAVTAIELLCVLISKNANLVGQLKPLLSEHIQT